MNALSEEASPSAATERWMEWVRSRARAGAVVSLVGASPALAEALRARGLSVRALPGPEWKRGKGPAPSLVVLEGDAVERVLEEGLEALRREAPGAELVFGLRNAGSARALMGALTGEAPVRAGLSEQRMLRRLAEAGYRVAHREVVPCASGGTALAEDTAQALRAVLAQVSPSTQVEEGLYVAVPDEPGRALVAGLLSVVVTVDPGARDAALDEALFALACQEQQPLELLLAAPEGVDLSAAEAALERYGRLGSFQARVVRASSGALYAEAVREARGRYLSFVDARCLVYPRHYVELVRALQTGREAWAVARAFRTEWASSEGTPPYVRAKVPFPLGERLEVEHLVQHPELVHAMVIDRGRIGPFAVATESGLGELPARLGALFPPVFLGGIASCEVRGPREPPAAAMAPGTWLLRPLDAWVEAVARIRDETLQAREFRHRMVDALNARVHGIPWVHSTLKTLANRLKSGNER
ncbi:glycosyltransferase family A protein [Corallococcus sp. AS-1-6]|uniref:glycosyltransferase family A protein n=1 Tax=Corallococcus sp. AS-1-6 TaxID=2874599 RepID=UPI001CBDDEEB|nr:glycosyltransferase family A protein [Corallococcus sp. AS-1-6]MBZ4372416.1 glycosyltransferase family 2 protein [Corallococcus sp. AS-1-6]